MDHDGGRSLNAVAQAPHRARGRSSPSRASWASRAPAADRQCRIAGLPVSSGEIEVAAQVRQLVRDRAEDAVVVEAGLADRDHALVGRPVGDPVPAGVIDLRGVVRMDADCGVEPVEPTHQVECPLARGDVPAGDEDALHAGQPGGADDRSASPLEAVGVEVAMRVDQAHRGMVGGPDTIDA